MPVRSSQSRNTQNPPSATKYHFSPRYAQAAGFGHRAARVSNLAIQLTALIVALLPAPALAQGVTLGDPMVAYANQLGTGPCNGCKLYAYIAGTTTPLDTYTTSALTVANPNPVILSAYGRAAVFLSDRAYKFTLTTSAGVEIWTVDDWIGRAPPANVLSKTANYTVTVTDGKDVFVKCDASGGNVTLSLYTSVGNPGRTVRAVKTDSSTNTCTVDPFGAQTINGAATYVLRTQYDQINILSDGVNWFIASVNALSSANAGPCNGRLTLTTAVPVTTGDVSAATSLYFTPYQGNECWVYDGSANWVRLTFSEITISLAGCTASKPYDVFVYSNSGTLAAEILVWTDATTRATAIERLHGTYVKTGANTRRYIGSFYCNASGGQTDDTAAKRWVYNAQHRRPAPVRVADATNTWTYNGAYQQANASTANQVDVLQGLAEDAIELELLGLASASGGGTIVAVAIGEDATTPVSGSLNGRATSTNSGYFLSPRAQLHKVPAVGRHYYTWLEYASSSTVTWYGDDGGGSPVAQTGISGLWQR